MELDPRGFVATHRISFTQPERVTVPLIYPWGTPLILAPAYAGFGCDIHALKIPNLACFLIFLLTLYFLARGYHSSVGTLLMVGAFATNPLLLRELNSIGSDIPFLSASTLSMLLIDTTVFRGRRLISKKWDASVLGLSLATSICVRPTGWLLVLPLMVAHAVKLKASQKSVDKDLVTNVETLSRGQACLPYILCGATLLVWNVIFPPNFSRLSAIPPMTSEILKQNFSAYLLLPVQFFYGAPYPWIFYIGALGLVIVGVRASWARTPHFIFYCITTLGLLVLWPFYQGARLTLPIAPFLFHFMLEGVRAVRADFGPRGMKRFDTASLSVGVFLIGSLCLTSVAGIQKNLRDQGIPVDGPFSKDAQEVFNFISTKTAPDDVIVFFKPRLMRLLTGRRSFESGARVALDQGNYICLFNGNVEDEGGSQLPQALFDDFVEQGLIQPVFGNAQFIVGKTHSSLR